MSDDKDVSPRREESMLPADWDELAPLLDAMLDTPRSDRAEMFATLSGGDAVRRAALEKLVADCEQESSFLDETAFQKFDELLEDPAAGLPPVLLDRYRTGRELGRGGMARVYIAHDLKHQRDVALKVIRPELAASLGREQLLREITIAARLRHPNIVPLYDSGDDAGALYFVMPYEAGPSLREKLQRGPLPISDAVSALHDVARALVYAHEQGIVHRDVKPDNVMLSSGAAVVTDFGIAKAVRAAQTESVAASFAHTGVFGTPAYMAPEQAANESSSDHRADIYSFGCMAYELFAGRPPFQGSSPEELIAAHAAATPQPITELRADTPPKVATLITRCLEKRPDMRPQTARELVSILDSALSLPESSANGTSATRSLIAASVLFVIALVAGIYFIDSRSASSALPTAKGPVTIAVMPLTDIGGDSAHAVVAAGLGDEIASALVKMPWLRIMSRRGVSNYRGRSDIDYREAGRELGARYLLSGTVRESSGHEIIALKLISAADGSEIWANRFDRPAAELEVQRDEMARSIGEALRPFAAPSLSAQNAQPERHRRTSGDAYFFQVQAQQWLNRRQRIRASADYFRKAIATDPGYAPAYAGLSLALALYPYFEKTAPAEVQNDLTDAAHHALQLDATLPQPHIALGMSYEQNGEWDAAGTEFRNAIELDNHDVEARVQYGRYLIFRRLTPEGLAQFQSAREDDPASPVVLSWVAYCYYLEGKMDSARVISERALQSNSMNITAVSFGSLILLADGRRNEARQLSLRAPADWPTTLYVLAMTGSQDATRLHIQDMLNKKPPPWLVHTASAYGMLGLRDTLGALDELEAATRRKEIWPALDAPTDRIFDAVRNHPRFKKLLRDVGLGDSAARIPTSMYSH